MVVNDHELFPPTFAEARIDNASHARLDRVGFVVERNDHVQGRHRVAGSYFKRDRLGRLGILLIAGDGVPHGRVRHDVLHAVVVHDSHMAIPKGLGHRLGDLRFGQDH